MHFNSVHLTQLRMNKINNPTKWECIASPYFVYPEININHVNHFAQACWLYNDSIFTDLTSFTPDFCEATLGVMKKSLSSISVATNRFWTSVLRERERVDEGSKTASPPWLKTAIRVKFAKDCGWWHPLTTPRISVHVWLYKTLHLVTNYLQSICPFFHEF